MHDLRLVLLATNLLLVIFVLIIIVLSVCLHLVLVVVGLRRLSRGQPS